jgi:putative hydrolase of the HAD superfamily
MRDSVPDREDLAAVLLDYGGTLDGDALHWFDHFVALYAAAGASIPREQLKRAFYAADDALVGAPGVRGFGLTSMTRTHVELQLAHLGIADPALATRLIDAFIADTRRAWDRNRPLLARLARRYRLGVVSNSYGNMPALIEDGDLGFFSVIVDSALAGLRKPDPAIYGLAARALGLPPSRILHVGDSWERDVAPAANAGMQTAWLARPDLAMPSTSTPVWRLSSLLDLEMLLR